MILTDPPYNVALGQHMRPSEAKQLRRRTDGLVIDNDEFKDEAQFEEFLYAALSAAVPHLKEGGAVYTWLAVMHMPAFASALARAGIMCKQMLVWVKNTFSLGRQDYQWRHEGCLYGWKPGAAHYFTDSRSESTVYEDLGKDPHKMSKAELIEMVEAMSGDSVATDVLHYDKPSRNEEHPTMKPVKLFAYQMRNSSRKGETVLDPFGGSGTSVIAAEQMGRRCLCMELDPHYCDVIITRWENMTGREAVLETGKLDKEMRVMRARVPGEEEHRPLLLLDVPQPRIQGLRLRGRASASSTKRRHERRRGARGNPARARRRLGHVPRIPHDRRPAVPVPEEGRQEDGGRAAG